MLLAAKVLTPLGDGVQVCGVANADSCTFPLQLVGFRNVQIGGPVIVGIWLNLPFDLPLVDKFHLDFPLCGLNCNYP